MANVHTPERQPNETLAEYRARQARSRAIAEKMQCVGIDGGKSSRESLRDKQRENGHLRGTYGIGLLQPERKRQQQRMAKLHPRDQHGAVTLTGRVTEFVDCKPEPASRWLHLGGSTDGVTYARRIWLGGLSAQRGY